MFWNTKLVGKATEINIVNGAKVELVNAVVENVKVNDKYYTNVIVFELNLIEQGKPKDDVKVAKNDELPF